MTYEERDNPIRIKALSNSKAGQKKRRKKAALDCPESIISIIITPRVADGHKTTRNGCYAPMFLHKGGRNE